MRPLVSITMLVALASCVGETPAGGSDTGTGADGGSSSGSGSSGASGSGSSSGGTDGGSGKCVLGQSHFGDGCKLGP